MREQKDPQLLKEVGDLSLSFIFNQIAIYPEIVVNRNYIIKKLACSEFVSLHTSLY
jgi:hypothetical protein